MDATKRAERGRLIWILALLLVVGALFGRAGADEPPARLGDVFRKAQDKPAPDTVKAPDKQPGKPLGNGPSEKAPPESAPPAAAGAEAATGDEAPPKKPEGISQAEWGRQLRSEGKNSAAIEALSEAIRLDPLDAISYRERGLAQLDVDAADQAIADFDRALALNGDDDEARWGCGQAFLKLDNLDSAFDEAEYLIEKLPLDPRFRRLRGHVLLQMLLHESALADYSEAVLLDPGDATSHRWRAKALVALGRLPEAAAELDEALRLEPDKAADFYGRALAHGALTDWQAMIDDLTECLRLEEKTPEILLQRAAAYSLTGQPGLAESDYLTAAIEVSTYKLAPWEPVLFQPTAAEPESAAEEELDPADVVAEFPIAAWSDGVIVPVRFAGRWMRFLVDTGASCTVLDRSHLDLLKPLERSATLSTSSGRVDMPLFEPIAFALGAGAATTTDGPVGCWDLSIAAEVASGKIDGILGLDLLTQFVLRLDMARQRIYFLRSCGDQDGVPIPFTEGSGEWSARIGLWTLPAVALHVGADREIFVDLDTGAVAGNLGIERDDYDALVAEHQIIPHRIEIKGSLDSIQLSPTGILTRVAVADFEHQNIAVDRSERGSKLGLRYLARYVATFDFPNRRLLLKPSPLFAVSEAELSLRLGKDWVDSMGTHTTETAQKEMDRIVAAHPDSVLGHQSRGLFAYRRGNFDLAIKDFSTAIELVGPTIELLYYRGAAHCSKRQWEQGTADLTQAILLEPTNPRLRQVRGMVWAERGNVELAIADLREAVRLYPQPETQKELDKLLARQASPQPARQTAEVKQAGSQGRARLLSRWRARRLARRCRWR